MKSELSKLYQLIDKYLSAQEKNSDVIKYQSPSDLQHLIKPEISQKGETYEQLFSHLAQYLKYSVNTGHSQFLNQLYAGFNLPAFIGDVITSLTNTSMYTYEVAPVASLLELELIKKMNEYTGFSVGDGIFVTGGSNANLVAMFSARNRKSPALKKIGAYLSAPMVAFVSDQAHYSFGSASNILGLGTDNLRKIKTNEKGKMEIDDLEQQIILSLKNKEIPFFIAATAGTTLLGAYDNIEEISTIAVKYNLWLHVDGSFGGSAILSKKQQHLFKGIEKADSFAWNPHKLMNIPLICSVILMKQKGNLSKNLIALNTDYIFHENESQQYDLGKKSIQCGRRVDSLKLWLAWKHYGDEGYEQRIDSLFEIAAYTFEKILQSDKLEILAPLQSLTVCFRYKTSENINPNDFNQQLRENLRMKGKLLVNYGFIGDTLAIRFVIVNPELTHEDIDHFVKLIIEEGDLLLNRH